MLYAARRANLGRSLMYTARMDITRRRALKQQAEEWPDYEKLTPYAKDELAELEVKAMGLNMVVVDDYAQGRGTVKAATDLGPVSVDVSKRSCSQCLSVLPCHHLVRMINAAGPTCATRVEALWPYHQTAECWKAMHARTDLMMPDFSG